MAGIQSGALIYFCAKYLLFPSIEVAAFHCFKTNAEVIFFCLFSFGCNYRNVGNTFPRLLNSKVEQKEDTGGHTPFSVLFLAQEKKKVIVR